MKKVFLLLAVLFSLIIVSEIHSQAFVRSDSLVYGDSAVTIVTKDYEEFYLDIYNRNADSVNTVALYDYNFKDWLMPIYVTDVSADYNWTNAATFTIAASTKATYRLDGNGFNRIRIQLTTGEGVGNRVDFVLRGINKVRK